MALKTLQQRDMSEAVCVHSVHSVTWFVPETQELENADTGCGRITSS